MDPSVGMDCVRQSNTLIGFCKAATLTIQIFEIDSDVIVKKQVYPFSQKKNKTIYVNHEWRIIWDHTTNAISSASISKKLVHQYVLNTLPQHLNGFRRECTIEHTTNCLETIRNWLFISGQNKNPFTKVKGQYHQAVSDSWFGLGWRLWLFNRFGSIGHCGFQRLSMDT